MKPWDIKETAAWFDSGGCEILISWHAYSFPFRPRVDMNMMMELNERHVLLLQRKGIGIYFRTPKSFFEVSQTLTRDQSPDLGIDTAFDMQTM